MITIKNSRADGIKEFCYLSNKEFLTEKGVSYHLNNFEVSPVEALKMDVSFDKSFQIPGNVNTRRALSEYLQALGISRNHKSYMACYKQLGENLPVGIDEMRGKNRNNNDPK